MLQKLCCNFILLCLLQACGGSGTSGKNPNNDLPTGNTRVSAKISENGFNIYFPDQFWVNQAASFAVKADNSSLKSVEWQQISGPTLTILTPNSQVISFDIIEAGTYNIELTAITTTNTTLNKTLTFNASENVDSLTTIRLDHAAVEQGKISLRVDTTPQASNKIIENIQWQQIAGPNVTELTNDEHYLFANAPNVEQDTLLEFSASIKFKDGTSGKDNAYVLVKNATINKDGFFPKYSEQIVTSDVFPYIAQGKYADRLVACVYNNQISSSCRFESLPLLGTEHPDPTIDDILERLVVSHQWMGDNFKLFLQQSATSDDMLKLLRATTAIVISYDVRPSFYWSATGAIYLDAANFWLSPAERDTLNDQPDYRSNFGNELKFTIPWRYVKNNQYYIRNSDYPAAARLSKSFDALEANVSWLMYHELGHANDFFPPSSWAQISSLTSPLSYVNSVEASSTSFSQSYPLTSDEMTSLARVSFGGNSASSAQKAFVATDIVGFFTPDKAPDYYCYSTIREDYATLFGHFMMAYRLGVSADVAIISSQNNDDLNVSWGQRNRVNSSAIQARVRAVVNDIFPQLNVVQIQSTLPQPILMKVGVDWFSNVDLSESPTASNMQAKSIQHKPADKQDYWQEFPIGPIIPNQ